MTTRFVTERFALPDAGMVLMEMSVLMLLLWIGVLDVNYMTWILVPELLIRWLMRVWGEWMSLGPFLIDEISWGFFIDFGGIFLYE